ncbi:hypothetical protein H0H81_004813 [Sphagnurus paluster]|uniref:Uncharacterized protein n=1 Tax=Sphagnurus paluster TaxID=117069 RepID=A0A9P7KLA5_9AGAR|nr:hypothetical protein H0H81_004813 [Sphagnurus paluster]
MTSRMPWVIVLALAGLVVAQIPSPTLSARQADPSPLLVFNSPNQPTSCAATLISWNYSGPDEPLSLSITNIGVSQDGSTSTRPPNTFTNRFAPREPLYRRDDITIQIASSLSPSSSSFNWTSVSVPQGFYLLTASLQNVQEPYSTNSSPFFVQQGTDTSCLNIPSSPSSSSPGSSSTPSTPSTSSEDATSSSDTSSSSSPTVIPIGGSSESTINKGAIVGGVVAGVLALLITLSAFCICRRRHSRSRSHSRNLSSPIAPSLAKGAFGFIGSGKASGGEGGRWGGLSSVDSHTAFTAPPQKSKKPYLSAVRRQSQKESAGAYPGVSQDDIDSYLSGNASRSVSAAHNNNNSGDSADPSEEMYMANLASSGHGTLSASANLNPSRRSYSASTFASELGTGPATTQRRASVNKKTRRPSIDSTASQQPSPFGTPPTVSPLGVTRSPSTSSTQPPQSQAQRKTPRKPVPRYSGSPSSPTSSPASPEPGSAPAPIPFDIASSPTHSMGHYATRKERESLKVAPSKDKGRSKSKSKKDKGDTSSANVSTDELAMHEAVLAHKSSFGPGLEGKQMHYLIPDMPVAQP